MELTATTKERRVRRWEKINIFNKKDYYRETPFRRYVPFFQHVYYYTREVPVDMGRPNENKADIHVIYSLLVCKWLFSFKDDRAELKKNRKYKLSNSDLFLVRWLAFDKTVGYYKDRADMHWGRPLDWEIPEPYRDFFNENSWETDKQRKGYLSLPWDMADSIFW